ncbi:hypothetical protein RB195_018510 [Necator americanus]|uniref:Uncharacterized protein n=1 Tax=Necator americanus TaxID=51031 RepID=A0ABR1CA36_NECAM
MIARDGQGMLKLTIDGTFRITMGLIIPTMRKNRRGIPILVKEKRLKRGELYYQQKKDDIMVSKLKDKRDLLMILTVRDGKIGSSKKPIVVEGYNKLMGFVDQND